MKMMFGDVVLYKFLTNQVWQIELKVPFGCSFMELDLF